MMNANGLFTRGRCGWGINGRYLGPTIRVWTLLRVIYSNRLTENVSMTVAGQNQAMVPVTHVAKR